MDGRKPRRILRALYTILLGNPRRTQPPSQRSPEPTRFKAWWDLVGSAIEHGAKLCVAEDRAFVTDQNQRCPAANISFPKLFLDSENDDEETAGLAELLVSLGKRWPGGFMARNLASYFAPDDQPPYDQAREMQSCLERAAGKPLRPVSASTIRWALKKLTDAPVEVDKDTVLVLRCKSDRHNGDTFSVVPLKG